MPINSTSLLSSSGIWLDIDLSFAIILAMLFVLMVILNKLVFQPFLTDMDERDSKTVKAREDAQSLKRKAAELKQRHEQLQAKQLGEAYDVRKELRVSGLKDKENSISSAKEESNKILSKAQADIDAQFEKARDEALTQVESSALEISHKLVGRAF